MKLRIRIYFWIVIGMYFFLEVFGVDEYCYEIEEQFECDDCGELEVECYDDVFMFGSVGFMCCCIDGYR